MSQASIPPPPVHGDGRPAAGANAVAPGCAVFPASFAQERLWFLSLFEPGSPFYNVPAASRMRGPIDAAALRRAIAEIARRHESLRTTIAEVDGQPMQVVAPVASVELVVVERRGLPEAGRDRESAALAADEARRSFDLARGPLLRCTLVRFAAADSLLLITMHHVISDAWSLGIFLRELTECYEAFSQHRIPSLPQLSIQYADFAHWQRQWAKSAY